MKPSVSHTVDRRAPARPRLGRGPTRLLQTVLVCCSAFIWLNVSAKVCINEILYHPPGENETVQWIELVNSGKEAVDLSGWGFSKGIQFQFPASTQIAPGGLVVLCRDAASFQQFYPGVQPAGVFKGKLKGGGEQLELKNAAGQVMDSVTFDDKAPWPVAPDGQTASLERITPDAPGNDPYNWAPSTLSRNPQRPSGTPGKPNSAYSPSLPPAITDLQLSPAEPAPNQPIQASVRLRPGSEAKSVTLLIKDARPGSESAEISLPLKPNGAGEWTGTLPARGSPGILRVRARVEGTNATRRTFPHPNEPHPALSLYVHEPLPTTRLAQAFIVQTTPNRLSGEINYTRSWNSPQKPPPPIQGTTAFVWIPSNGAPAQVRDFVTVQERSAGWKIHLHKDQPVDRMTTLNFTFEDHERFVVAEPLAYGLHRRAGIPASRTEFVRLTFDNRPLGYHVMIEQPNKAFLKRHGRTSDGHLYKLQWFGNSLVEQHEKKTRVAEGHGDLTTLVNQLSKNRGEAQWQIIRTNFNVEETLTYFAVSSLTAYWDGFFNNYFTYHDTHTGRWELYPWDLDKAMGYHDAIGDGVFVELPLTYGAEGDKPPGWKGRPPRTFFEANSAWWRPGGWFSKWILSNPTSQKLYYARIRELLDTEFTEEKMGAAIDAMRDQLQDEVKFRAKVTGDDPRRAERRLETHLKLLREFVHKRREYLLAQPEIASAGPFDRSLLK